MTVAEVYVIGVLTSLIYCCLRSVISFKKINNPAIEEKSYDKLTKHYVELFQIKKNIGDAGVAFAATIGIVVFSFLWFIFIPFGIVKRILK